MGKLADEVRGLASVSELDKLKKANALLVAELERTRAARVQLPIGTKRGKKSKSFCRVVIPDTHGCLIDGPAWSAFLTDLEAIQPQEIVWLGDHLDCGGFLAQHHTMSYVDDAGYTFAEDVAMANQQLDAVAKLCPQADQHYMEGNHERRIEAWIVERTLRNQDDAKFLRTMFSPEVVLHIEQRKITYYKQNHCYSGNSVPNVMSLGKCNFTHGYYTNAHAAAKHVMEYAENIVYAHTHRADSFVRRTLKGTVGAWNPGCLCQLQKRWNHSRITHWSHGYGLQAVQVDGSFLHINVPIIDGVSLLKPLIGNFGK